MTPPITIDLSPDRLECRGCDEAWTPPRAEVRTEPPTCRSAPVAAPPRILLTPPSFRLPPLFSRPLSEILRPNPFRLDTSLLRAGEAREATPPRRLSLVDFLPAIASLAAPRCSRYWPTRWFARRSSGAICSALR
ncbi:hypothetical protein FBR05_14945 [Deltaproteobacteria bacterium PRO3]|nr:hypothetical protein [Deltaproteobacteria bacterium PRO3]